MKRILPINLPNVTRPPERRRPEPRDGTPLRSTSGRREPEPKSPLEAALRRACGELHGLSQEEVAGRLRDSGLRGIPRDARHCVLARWLAGRPGLEDARVETSGGQAVASRDEERAHCFLPAGAYAFDVAFDGGRWSELDATDYCDCDRPDTRPDTGTQGEPS